jgi:hypothetical protein
MILKRIENEIERIESGSLSRIVPFSRGAVGPGALSWDQVTPRRGPSVRMPGGRRAKVQMCEESGE